MTLSAPLISIIKYGFLGLVVTGAGFLIANTAVTMHYKSEKMEYLAYKVQPRDSPSLPLNRNSLLCLIYPSKKPFCLMSSKKRLKLLKNFHHNSTSIELSDTGKRPRQHPLYVLMKDFVDVSTSVNMRPMLLEPSILFCMLTTLQKYSVISNNLQTKVLQGSPHSVTFGLFESDSTVLTRESSLKRYLDIGFEFRRSQSWLDQNGESVDASYSFSRHNLTVTVIVFFQRDTFLWHPGSLGNESRYHPQQFASSMAYENFTAVPFLLEDGRQNGFYLPSDIANFVLQIQRSEFEECTPTTEETPVSHPTLTREQLSQRVLIVIQELKSVLRPLLGTFWMWSRTLSDWEENCDLFQKTSDFNVAVGVPISAVPKWDLNGTFMDNEYFHVVEHHQWDDFNLHVTLDCYGLLIHITVMYMDRDSMWNYEKDSAGDLIRHYHSNQRLCSTLILGQLVHKPCSNQTLS